jgi:hypothetical protein
MTDQNAASSTPDDTEDQGIVEDHDEMLGGRGSDSDDPASKDPADWVTGDEPMTAAQRSYLDTLAREAGEEVPGDLSKAQASAEIERLQRLTGRGQ